MCTFDGDEKYGMALSSWFLFRVLELVLISMDLVNRFFLLETLFLTSMVFAPSFTFG